MNLLDFTIAMIAYNAEKTIERAIISALNTPILSLLIIDNDSTDNTASIIKKHQKRDKRINYVYNQQNISTGYARNIALDHIKTPHAIWLDADDEIIEGFPQKAYKLFKSFSYDIIYCDVIMVNHKHETKQVIIPDILKKQPYYEIERHWAFSGNAKAFNVDAIKKIGYDNESFNEDYILKLNAFIKRLTIGYLNEVGYIYYHGHQTSLSSKKHLLNASLKNSLVKINEEKLFSLLISTSYSSISIRWIKASFYMFCHDYRKVLDELTLLIHEEKEIDEIHPLYHMPYSYLVNFLIGTSYLLTGDTNNAF